MRSAFVRARVEPHLKDVAEQILEALGITPTQAISMLYKQIAFRHEWPVELKVPNAITRQVFAETDRGEGLVQSETVNEMFEKLGI